MRPCDRSIRFLPKMRPHRLRLGVDRDLEHLLPPVPEQVVCCVDLVEVEPVRDERCEAELAVCDHVHESAAAVLPTGCRRRDDSLLTDATHERAGVEWERQASV